MSHMAGMSSRVLGNGRLDANGNCTVPVSDVWRRRRPIQKLACCEEADHADDETNEGNGKNDETVADVESAALKDARNTGLGLIRLTDGVQDAGETDPLRQLRDGDDMQLVTQVAGDEAVIGGLVLGRDRHLLSYLLKTRD